MMEESKVVASFQRVSLESQTLMNGPTAYHQTMDGSLELQAIEDSTNNNTKMASCYSENVNSRASQKDEESAVIDIKPLTVKGVHDMLNCEGYPMTWTEFQLKYLPKSPQSLDVMTNFRKVLAQTNSGDILCHCEDFISLNYPFHRNRIKLQLILEIRRRSNQASEIHVDEFQKQFEEIATDHEIEQTKLKCVNFQQYLSKFQSVFSVNDNGFVKQHTRAMHFNSFFKFEKKKAASSSVLHKLLYFVNISGKFCTLSHAVRFLQTHIVVAKEKSLVDTLEKIVSFIKNCDRLVFDSGFLHIKTGNTSDESKSKKADKSTGPSKKVVIASHIKFMEVILDRRGLPLSWEDVEEEYSLARDYQYAKCWVKELKEQILPMTPSHPFIFSEDFIALNNPLHKGHLKMCLLVEWNAKREVPCTLELLRQQLEEIATNSERKVIEGEGESLKSKFDDLEGIFDVTWVPDEMSPCILLPGENMISFSGFFHCGEHGPSTCMPCSLAYFVNMCGGNCSYERAFNFAKMSMTADSQFTGDEMDVLYFLQSCDSLSISSDGETVSLFGAAEQEKSSNKKKHCDPSTGRKEGQAQKKLQKTVNSCKTLSLPPSKEKKIAVTMDTSDHKKHIVFVQFVESKKAVKGILQRIQSNGKGMHVSMAIHQNVLAVIVAGGPAFVIPNSKTQDNLGEKKKMIAEIFENPMITKMVFDCGKFADAFLNLFDIQLEGRLHDTKVGLDLLLQHGHLTVNSEKSSNLEDLCRYFDVPGPGNIMVEISNTEGTAKGGPKKELPHKLKMRDIQRAVSEAYVQSPTLLTKLDSLIGSLHLRKRYLQTCKSVLEEVYCRHDGEGSSSLQPLHDTFPVVEEFRMDPPASAIPTSPSPGIYQQEGVSQDALVLYENETLPNGSILTEEEFNVDEWFQSSGGTTTFHDMPSEGNQPPIKTLCQDERGQVIMVPFQETHTYNTNLANLNQELMEFYDRESQKEVMKLLNLLGEDVQRTLVEALQTNPVIYNQMTEIVLDLGRKALARFSTNTHDGMPLTLPASQEIISRCYFEEIEKKEEFTGFDDENRAGVEGTLHSLRGVRNRKGQLIGLTVHINLPWLGCADMLYDIAHSGKSIVVLGHLGVGKTTLLRELARCLSVHAKKRVVVIDTFNEIAGDSDISHYSIGGARRFQVESFATQYETMLEVSKNHNPEILIVDEIESPEDANILSVLCRKGIQVIAAVRDKSVPTLLSNQNLSQLFSSDDNRMELPDWSEPSRSSTGATSMSKVKPAIQMALLMVEKDWWLLHDLCPERGDQDICSPAEERYRVFSSQTPMPYFEQNILIREMPH